MLRAGNTHEFVIRNGIMGPIFLRGFLSPQQVGLCSSLWERRCAGPGTIFSQTFTVWEQYGKEWPRPVPSGTGPRLLAALFSLYLALNLFTVLGNALYLLVFTPVYLFRVTLTF